MLPNGRFRQAGGLPWSTRILFGAGLIAAIAGAFAIAALAISMAAILIPVALLAAIVAWAAMRWRRWQAKLFRSRGQSLRP